MDYRHHQHYTPGRHCYYPFYISQLWQLRLKVHSGQSEAETTHSVQGPYWTTGKPAFHGCWTAPPVSRPRGRSPARSLRKAPGHSVISPFEDQESRNTGPAFTEELRAQDRTTLVHLLHTEGRSSPQCVTDHHSKVLNIPRDVQVHPSVILGLGVSELLALRWSCEEIVQGHARVPCPRRGEWVGQRVHEATALKLTSGTDR